jgi:hypothetical protein
MRFSRRWCPAVRQNKNPDFMVDPHGDAAMPKFIFKKHWKPRPESKKVDLKRSSFF